MGRPLDVRQPQAATWRFRNQSPVAALGSPAEEPPCGCCDSRSLSIPDGSNSPSMEAAEHLFNDVDRCSHQADCNDRILMVGDLHLFPHGQRYPALSCDVPEMTLP